MAKKAPQAGSKPSQPTVPTFVFQKGVVDLNQLPKGGAIEIALIGRSNVGKSSFLNTVSNNSKLARVSSEPGKTREINFYRTNPAALWPRGLYLVDLPGYGYAKIPRAARAELAEVIEDYIQVRQELKIVNLLIDCRRDPEESELAIVKVALESNKHLNIILSKCDKLSSSELSKRTKRISQVLFEFCGQLTEISAATYDSAVTSELSMDMPTLMLGGKGTFTKRTTSTFWQLVRQVAAKSD